MHEDERSGSTGLPVWLTRSGDPAVIFDVEEGEDLADAAIQAFDKAQKGPKGNKEPAPGSYRYVVPKSLDGATPVPEGGLARERLLIEADKRRKEGGGVLPGSNLDIQRKRPAGGYDISQYG